MFHLEGDFLYKINNSNIRERKREKIPTIRINKNANEIIKKRGKHNWSIKNYVYYYIILCMMEFICVLMCFMQKKIIFLFLSHSFSVISINFICFISFGLCVALTTYKINEILQERKLSILL